MSNGKYHQDYDVIIVGNGAIAIASAFSLWEKNPDCKIALVGPSTRAGCASTAAGAMLNSFAEIESGSLDHPLSAFRFSLNRQAAGLWESWIEKINRASPSPALQLQYGTHIIQNASADTLDELNFKAILNALEQYKEPYEFTDPNMISGYFPEARARALSAIYLPNEGFYNPRALFSSYDAFLSQHTREIQCVDDIAVTLTITDPQKKIITTQNGTTLSAPQLLIAAGAASQILIDQLPLPKNKIPRLFYGIGTGILFKSPQHAINSVIRTANRGMACGVHLVPQDADTIYVGATNRISPWPEYTPRLTNLYMLLQAAMEQLNVNFYNAEFSQMTVGHRPTTLDTFPLLGETSIPDVFIASGTKRDGLFLSPLLGDMMSTLIRREPLSFDNPFKPERSLIHTLTKAEGIKKAVAHLSSAAYQHELRLPKSGWENFLQDSLEHKIHKIYDRCGITDFGIPPEMLDMYQHGHADPYLK